MDNHFWGYLHGGHLHLRVHWRDPSENLSQLVLTSPHLCLILDELLSQIVKLHPYQSLCPLIKQPSKTYYFITSIS